MQNPLRNLPSVNELLESPQLKNLVDSVSHNVVVSGVRTVLDDLRTDLREASKEIQVPTPSELAERIAAWISRDERPVLRPVINATGILLHTGLGRAPISEEAAGEMVSVASHYASVEVDLASGERSQRVLAVEKLLCDLTGAEAATVVNNNAAATLLTLTALAFDQEVVVSRGQLIEIGGSFRLPDVMTSAGSKLHEVGTTNKTRISDYETAINENTAALMNVHPSNYVVMGFTEQPGIKKIAELGRQRNLIVIDDIGSGALLDFSQYGVNGEPVASESIKAGADVVLFSGDKLLGGPQCGIIVGRKSVVQRIAKHPMMRAMRVDKVTLSALAATLRPYRDLEQAESHIPLLALLSTPIENLKNRAERLAPQIAAAAAIETAEAIEDRAMLGGGSVPSQEIPTWCIAVKPAAGNVGNLAQTLRTGSPSIFGRIQQDRLLIDLRTVFPKQDAEIVNAIAALHPDAHAKPPLNAIADAN